MSLPPPLAQTLSPAGTAPGYSPHAAKNRTCSITPDAQSTTALRIFIQALLRPLSSRLVGSAMCCDIAKHGSCPPRPSLTLPDCDRAATSRPSPTAVYQFG